MICLVIYNSSLCCAVQAQYLTDKQQVDSILRESPAFSIYNDNYFLIGSQFGQVPTEFNSDAKFQISFKQKLFKTKSAFRSSIFLIYTQRSFWGIFRSSSPFAETNYNPGIAINKVFVNTKRLVGVGMISLEHESNVKDSIYSRSWNMVGFNYRIAINQSLMVNFKAWIPFMFSENETLFDYIGFAETSCTWAVIKSRLFFDFSFRKGQTRSYGNISMSLNFKLNPKSNQYLTLQLYRGQGESLIRYEEWTNKLRIGICIKPTRSFFY